MVHLVLFYNQIVPKNNTGWWPGPKSLTWNTQPMVTNDLMDLAKSSDWYKSPFNTKFIPDTPWYRDWLWYTGIIIGVTVVAAIVYGGFSYYQSIYNPGPATPPAAPLPPVAPHAPAETIFEAGSSGSGTPTNPPINPLIGAAESITSFISNVKDSTTKALNPFNWFNSESVVEGKRRAFISTQTEANTYDNRFYPFTSVDPFKPWHQRLRIGLFGENNAEVLERMRYRDFALREAIALSVKPITSTGFYTPGNVGLRFDSSTGAMDWITASSSFERTSALFSSIPATPRHIPTIEVLDASIEEWASQPKIPTTGYGFPDDLDSPVFTEPEIEMFS